MPFLNIFSKKPEKIPQKSKIIIDNREKSSLIPSLLIKNQFPIEFKNLPVADYLINNTAIERKTISDLKSSIINKRIISQLLELKQYPKHLLLVEGFEETPYNGYLHENAFRGFLLATALEFQVPIIFTRNSEDTAKYLAVLASKKPKSESSLRATKIFKSKTDQQQQILEGFPHIGPAKAKALLKKFKTLNNIFNAEEQELKEILGKRASEFKLLLN